MRCTYVYPNCMHQVMGWGCTCRTKKAIADREELIERRLTRLEKIVAKLPQHLTKPA